MITPEEAQRRFEDRYMFARIDEHVVVGAWIESDSDDEDIVGVVFPDPAGFPMALAILLREFRANAPDEMFLHEIAHVDDLMTATHFVTAFTLSAMRETDKDIAFTFLARRWNSVLEAFEDLTTDEQERLYTQIRDQREHLEQYMTLVVDMQHAAQAGNN